MKFEIMCVCVCVLGHVSLVDQGVSCLHSIVSGFLLFVIEEKAHKDPAALILKETIISLFGLSETLLKVMYAMPHFKTPGALCNLIG